VVGVQYMAILSFALFRLCIYRGYINKNLLYFLSSTCFVCFVHFLWSSWWCLEYQEGNEIKFLMKGKSVFFLLLHDSVEGAL